VVFAKVRERPPAERRHAAPAPADEPRRNWGLLVLGGALLFVAVVVLVPRARRAPPPAPPAQPEARVAESGAEAAEVPQEALSLSPIEPLPLPSAPSGGVSGADKETASRLIARLESSRTATDDDIRDAESLFASYPGEDALRQLLVGALLARAQRDHGQGRHREALVRVDRALGVEPGSLPARKGRMAVCLALGDWSGAEQAARDVLASGTDPDAAYALGFALFRQDRNREAVDALAPYEGDSRVAALLGRLQKGLADERGMREQNLSHFHVRYDGEEHDEVGREVLRALERHYATLVQSFGHEPKDAIPVILFSRTAYHQASGAPAWSGGNFDGLDGRIRVPIGGLTRSLSPDMDGTLIHELTHAFIWDMSGGNAPREIHEGMAQYMEGDRTEAKLSKDMLRALANGQLGGVHGFYAGALSFVEHLMAQRGQGGMNELLLAMRTDEQDAFQAVYGRSLAELKKDWAVRLRQRFGD
jgi:tetratricopeptide (TPR) repeat protein